MNPIKFEDPNNQIEMFKVSFAELYQKLKEKKFKVFIFALLNQFYQQLKPLATPSDLSTPMVVSRNKRFQDADHLVQQVLLNMIGNLKMASKIIAVRGSYGAYPGFSNDPESIEALTAIETQLNTVLETYTDDNNEYVYNIDSNPIRRLLVDFVGEFNPENMSAIKSLMNRMSAQIESLK